MRPCSMEACLICHILDTDLLTLRSDEAVAASYSIRSSCLLSGGAIIIGEAKDKVMNTALVTQLQANHSLEVVIPLRTWRIAENSQSRSNLSSLSSSSLFLSWRLTEVLLQGNLLGLLESTTVSGRVAN